MSEGKLAFSGDLRPQVIHPRSWVPQDLDARLRSYRPRTHLGDVVRACFKYLPLDLAIELLDQMKILLIGESTLEVDVHHANGERESWGVVSHKVVTDAAVARLVSAFQNLVAIGDWNYHGLGTGTSAEVASDTALQTELTTQYNPNNTRVAGVVSAPAANQYRTQGSTTVDGAVTVQEHGILSQAASPGGTLLDRSLTGGQNLVFGSTLVTTYTLTLASGG